MVKILLTSDIHLGSEIEKLPVPESYRFKTIKKLSYLAKSHDLFIIAGDLFHNNGITEKNVDIIAGEFKYLRENGVEIIYALGEHECSENNNTDLSRLNVSKMFSDNEGASPYRFVKNNQEIFIYGLPAYGKNSISGIEKIPGNGFHIGVFHANFYLSEDENKTAKVCAINKEDIISLNLDFYALGHNHQFKLFKSGGRYIGAYPGSPEAVTLDENGDRYALSIIVKDNEIYQIKRLTVNSSRLECNVFDCSESNDLDPLLQALRDKKNRDTILKILLTGKRNFKIDDNEINKIKNEYLGIYIEDKSSLTANVFTDEFAGEESLRGEFFSIFEEKVKNNKVPADIDVEILSDIFNKIINSGLYSLEDLCNYWNA